MRTLFVVGILSALSTLTADFSFGALPRQTPTQLTGISFKTSRTCREGAPCFSITPDSKGVILLNPQKQLYFINVQTGERTKIADTDCSSRNCFAVSQDTKSLAFLRQDGEEMAVYLAFLPGAAEFIAKSAPRRLGALPRFAATKPLSAEYDLKFCGSNETVFARAGKPGGTSGIHAFDTSKKGAAK